jgi:hypothetical protein
LIKKYLKHAEDKESTKNLILQRLRDYHDPLASGTEDEGEINNWNKFVVALLVVWIKE